MERNKNKKNKTQWGFTLIELLVVIAIIALLTTLALVALSSAREKGRNTKRLADMTQMNYAMELYYAQNKGYPADLDDNGMPDNIEEFTSVPPRAPTPADGDLCEADFFPCGGSGQPNCVEANTYSYVPAGNSYSVNGVTVYSDYDYYFCLGAQTGNFPPGVRILNPKGVR
jgi:prepilin-type N-terminal cleavage/methylation domain-containing protein